MSELLVMALPIWLGLMAIAWLLWTLSKEACHRWHQWRAFREYRKFNEELQRERALRGLAQMGKR